MVDEIPNNQKITVIAHTVDNGKLVIQALPHFLRDFRIAGRQCLFAESPQISFIILVGFRNGIIRQLNMAKLKIYLTALGNFYGIAKGFRVRRKQPRHFFGGFQVIIIAVKAHSIRVIHGLTHLNTEQDIVEFAVFPAHIMAIVGRNQTDAVFIR